MPDVQNIKELLEKYSCVNTEVKKNVISNKIENIHELLRRYMPFLAEIKEAHRIEAPHYNLFKILQIDHLEAKVHTPFLKNLLDINGSHSQSDLFFDSFLENVIRKNEELFHNLKKENIQVKSEYKTSKGIIDILIRYRHSIKNLNFVIIIENKLYAGDQSDQLNRYYSYAKQDLKLLDEQIFLIYLKPQKSTPSEVSIESKLRNSLEQKGVFKSIGYNPDIVNWLTLCNSKIISQKLKQTIIQYIDIINNFPYEKDEPGNI